MIEFLVQYAKKSHEKAFTAFRVKALRGEWHSAVIMPTYLRVGKDLVSDESDMSLATYYNQIRIEANRRLAKKTKIFSWAGITFSCVLAFLAVPVLWSMHEPSRPLAHTIQLMGAHKAVNVLPDGAMKERARALAEKLEERLERDAEARQRPANEVKDAASGAISSMRDVAKEKSSEIKGRREAKDAAVQNEFKYFKSELGSF